MKTSTLFILAFLALSALADVSVSVKKPVVSVKVDGPHIKQPVVSVHVDGPIIQEPFVRAKDEKPVVAVSESSSKSVSESEPRVNDFGWMLKRTEESSYKLKEGEQFVGSELTVTDGVAGVWRNTTESKLEVVDGKLVNTIYSRKQWVDSHRKIQKVRKVFHTNIQIASVFDVIKQYSAGAALSDLEFELFNAIAVTEGNHFHMKYAVRSIKREQLSATLRKYNIKIKIEKFCQAI